MLHNGFMSEAFLHNWSKGIDFLIENSRFKGREIAESVGISPRHLSNIKLGHSRPGHDLMENLSEVLGYTPDHIAQIGRDVLEGRQPEMRRSCTGWDEFKIVPMVKAQPRGGTSSLVTDDRFSRHYVFREDFLQRKGNPESMVMFRVWGDSMSPLISDQDVILVDQSQHHAQEGRIFVVGLDDDVLVKRIGRRPGKLVLRSENPEWEDVEIDIHDESIDCRIYGKAIWIGKELV